MDCVDDLDHQFSRRTKKFPCHDLADGHSGNADWLLTLNPGREFFAVTRFIESLIHSGRAALLCCVLTLSACADDQNGRDFDTIQFGRPIDPALVANTIDLPDGQQQQFDLREWFGRVPLGGETPILRVEERIDVVVVEASDENVFIDWRLPGPQGHVYLRFSDSMFAPDSCPTSGTPSDTGAAELAALDGFDHPIRQITLWPFSHAVVDVTDPQLNIGGRYYVQGCELAFDSGLFTGAETNTVVIEVASALPDLTIRELRTLGRSPSAIGKLFIRVEDLNAAVEREIRSDNFPYTISIFSEFGDSVGEFRGTASLLPNASAWIIPGSETPDLSDDIQIPDDGLFYDVTVNVNNALTSINFPEASHFNNSMNARVRTRPKPLVLGIDRIAVVENCNSFFSESWRMIMDISADAREIRLVADGTVDVDDNSVVNPKRGFRLFGTDVNSSVRARLGFTTGDDDLVGFANTFLSGVTVDSMATATAVASEESCGPAPFTATFQLMTEQQAIDDGYLPANITNVPLR